MADSYVCSGAMMKCTMGTSPAKLTVLPSRTVYLAGQPQANISDHQSMVNLGPFGLCRSLGYPATASATAAALGTLTPMPCMHNTPVPWMGGKTDHLVKGQPALLQSCKCQCMWGGTISLINNGQVSEGAQGVNAKKKASGKTSINKQGLGNYNEENQNGQANSPQSLLEAQKKLREANEKARGELSSFLKGKPEWFKNGGTFKTQSGEVITIDGFQELVLDTNPQHNGSTNKYGTIKLSSSVMANCVSAFQKIKKGKKLTKQEEESMATLWHEINHNMHDVSKDTDAKLSDTNRDYMETANEFVSRKTLPEFYKALGGEMSYPVFMENRGNTKYNPWVVKYQNAIKDYKLDESVVLETVRKGLYETDYHKQRANLINGLLMGGQYIDEATHSCRNKITPKEAKAIVDGLFS